MVRSSLAVSPALFRSHPEPTAESATRISKMPNDMLIRRTMAKSTNALSGRQMLHMMFLHDLWLCPSTSHKYYARRDYRDKHQKRHEEIWGSDHRVFKFDNAFSDYIACMRYFVVAVRGECTKGINETWFWKGLTMYMWKYASRVYSSSSTTNQIYQDSNKRKHLMRRTWCSPRMNSKCGNEPLGIYNVSILISEGFLQEGWISKYGICRGTGFEGSNTASVSLLNSL